MKQLMIMWAFSLLTSACGGKKVQSTNSAKQLAMTDTSSNNPKIDVKVNKKFDNNGNLIQYDSTYSYFYSSPELRDSIIRSDSLFNNFRAPLINNYKGLEDQNMNNIFFNDSLLKYDFFNNDYFSKRFQMNIKQFENMFMQMDSIKSKMFRQYYPDGKIKKEGIRNMQQK